MDAAAAPKMMTSRGTFANQLTERFKVLDSIAHNSRFPLLPNDFGVGAKTAAFRLWNKRLLSIRQANVPENSWCFAQACDLRGL